MSGTLDSPAAWQCFLVDFFHAGDYHALEREAQRALVAAQRAVTLAPDDADALVNLGNILRAGATRPSARRADQGLPEREAVHFIERRWCLPQTYYVFGPPASPGRNLAKLSEPMFTAWCEILRQLPAASCQLPDARCQMPDARCQMPAAQLYLKAPQPNSAEVLQAVEARFAAGGIRREPAPRSGFVLPRRLDCR